MKGIDCAAAIKPEWANQLHILGYGFVARYYRRTLVTSWAISPEEAAAIFDAGLYLLSVFEGGAEATKPSYYTAANGVADAHAAVAKAQQMKQPRNSAIYFAVDCDISHEMLASVSDYFKRVMGIVTVEGYRVGAYGSGLVLKTLKAQNLVEHTWLANAAGWQGSRDYTGWDVKQTTLPFILPFGLQVDGDECPDPARAGLWRPIQAPDVVSVPEPEKPAPAPSARPWWAVLIEAILAWFRRG